MKRSRIRPYRATPRRRTAPRWSADEWEAADWQLRTRANGCCECCGQPLDGYGPATTERHHRQRRRDGGDRLSNLLLLRRECHQWITEHPDLARENGWIVPVGQHPMTVPVLLRSAWWYIDDDGSKTPALNR